MLIDLRTYTVHPGTMAAQLALYEKFGYPVQLRYMGEPHFYLTAETGELNTIVHGWAYDSAGDREDKRGRMAKDPAWKVYIAENGKAGNLASQRTVLMTPTSFSPPIPMPKIHS